MNIIPYQKSDGGGNWRAEANIHHKLENWCLRKADDIQKLLKCKDFYLCKFRWSGDINWPSADSWRWKYMYYGYKITAWSPIRGLLHVKCKQPHLSCSHVYHSVGKNINDSKSGDIKVLNKGNHIRKLDSEVLL